MASPADVRRLDAAGQEARALQRGGEQDVHGRVLQVLAHVDWGPHRGPVQGALVHQLRPHDWAVRLQHVRSVTSNAVRYYFEGSQ